MASPANKNSSFSPPIPNRPNPKPRNSEASDPLRRSFGGNPFPANTKVNIPSDFSRRNSFGGDKENETKAVLAPKGSKNFMSPTISAVSKINPSPRKRVLSDKNEMSRSFSDVKGLILEDNKRNHHRAKSCVSFSDVIHTICIDEKNKFEFEESHDMTVTDFDENEVYENKGITYSDPRFRISPRPSVPYTSPEFAAREVNTLLPPYDPKKNYLSPRPQFLHYKPNPRIEKRFDECKQLEELFISESSSSDTELSVEESEKCEEEEKNGAEAVIEEETEDVEQLEAESDEEMVCESIEETSQAPKQSGFSKFNFFGLFLALAMAYLLISANISLPTESAFYEFHIPKAITKFSKANNLEQLSEKLWTLTESSLVYIDKLISCLRGGEEEYGPLQFHNLTYTLEDDTVFQPTSVEINEEPLQEKSRVENNLEDVYGEDGGAETNEFDEQSEMRPGTDIELNEGEGNLKALFKDGVEWHIEEQREFDSEVNPTENNNVTVSTKKDQKESEAIYINQHDVELAVINKHQQKEIEVADVESGSEEACGETAVETSNDLHSKPRSSNKADNDIAKSDAQSGSDVDAENGSEDAFGEIAAETSDDLHPKVKSSNKADNDLHSKPRSSNKADNDIAKSDAQSGSDVDAENGSEDAFGEIAAETSDDLHPKVKSSNKADNDSAKVVIVLSSTLVVLLAAVAFLFSKKAKPVAASAPKTAPGTTEELNLGHEPAENLMKEKLSSLNFEEEVDERMSISFNKKSSFLKDPQSGGGKKSTSTSSKLRRESMASSASEYSVGSFSYGSFTTYEKIPIKSDDREEEMITPVRRSSRIRKNQPSGL